jgi:hypothetical protein
MDKKEKNQIALGSIAALFAVTSLAIMCSPSDRKVDESILETFQGFAALGFGCTSVTTGLMATLGLTK